MDQHQRSDWLDLMPLEQLPRGSYRVVDVDGDRVAVFNPDGQPCAIEDRCSHDGGSLCNGYQHGSLEGNAITCPRHGARFSIRNGKALSVPAYEDLHVFPVRVVNGRVQLRDDRWDE